MCHLCGHDYVSLSDLNSHMMIHTGITFTCEQCGKSCQSQKSMDNHMQYHFKGPFTYDCFDKQFGLQSTLRNHKKMHREKDYVCKVGDCHHRTKSYSGYYEYNKYRHLEDTNFSMWFLQMQIPDTKPTISPS